MREDVMHLLSTTDTHHDPDRSTPLGLPLMPPPLHADERAESLRPVPTGLFRRLFSLGTLQARVGAAYALCRVRELFATDDEKQALRSGAHLASAMRLLAGAGYLRGAVTKVAQALANYPNLSPEEYIDVLDSLHFQAPPMHFSLLREQVQRDLGGPPEDLFRSFDTHAFAAASLGQVHAARNEGGERLAVKVQYPGVARAIVTDTKALYRLVRTMPFLKDKSYDCDVIQEVQSGLLSETNYRQEAEHARLVRRALQDVDDVVVPRVHEATSSERVITLDFIDGEHITEFLKRRPSQAVRDRAGAAILRAAARLYYSHRTLLGDPGPGNFLFMPDGRIGIVDFGCYRTFTDEEWEAICGVIRAESDPAKLDAALLRCARMDHEPDVDLEHLESIRRSSGWYFESLMRDEPFDFGDRAYLERGMNATRRVLERRHTRQMPVFIWQTRCFTGLRVLLHRLGARVNQRRIDNEERQRAGIPSIAFTQNSRFP